jgi:hypothetical protein
VQWSSHRDHKVQWPAAENLKELNAISYFFWGCFCGQISKSANRCTPERFDGASSYNHENHIVRLKGQNEARVNSDFVTSNTCKKMTKIRGRHEEQQSFAPSSRGLNGVHSSPPRSEKDNGDSKEMKPQPTCIRICCITQGG